MRIRNEVQRLERETTVRRGAHFREEQHVDGSCSSMDTYGFCHYLHTDKLGRIDKEGARGNEGVDTRGSGKHPN